MTRDMRQLKNYIFPLILKTSTHPSTRNTKNEQIHDTYVGVGGYYAVIMLFVINNIINFFRIKTVCKTLLVTYLRIYN